MFTNEEISIVRRTIEHRRAPDGSLTLSSEEYKELRWFIQSLQITIQEQSKMLSEVRKTFILTPSNKGNENDDTNVVYLFSKR